MLGKKATDVCFKGMTKGEEKGRQHHQTYYCVRQVSHVPCGCRER
jgi:hypothetical protein